MKLDDTDWHEQDPSAQSALASSHIASAFCALLKGRMISNEVIAEWKIEYPIDQSRKPSDYLDYYSDGKLFSDYLKSNIKKAFEKIYEHRYLDDINELELERDFTIDAPYNILDNWKNVDIVLAYFEAKLNK